MENLHNLTSTAVDIHSFEVTVDYLRSFTTIASIDRSFESVLEDSYFSSNSLWAKIDIVNNISVVDSGISIGKNVDTIIDSLFTIYDVETMYANIRPVVDFLDAIPILADMKLAREFSGINFVITNDITANINSELPIYTVNIASPDIIMSASAVNNRYYLVSDWDSSLLSVLDSKLLSEMDYQIV